MPVRHDDREIPTPEQVWGLLHTDWTPSPRTSYTNALIKGILVYDFLFGVRTPSEPFALRLENFDPERHLITVREPKKSGKRRRLLIDTEHEWMCWSRRHPSLANYLVWRDKVDPNREHDAFFLRTTGRGTVRPFPTKEAMGRFLWKHVRPRFPWFNPYVGRHWSVNARLIEWEWDYSRVADWHGHDSVSMTRKHYEHESRIYRRLHGDNWLWRAARKTKKQAR
jgi:hypothetical protein